MGDRRQGNEFHTEHVKPGRSEKAVLASLTVYRGTLAGQPNHFTASSHRHLQSPTFPHFCLASAILGRKQGIILFSATKMSSLWGEQLS